VAFVNENLGGHATMHLGLRTVLLERPDVVAEFLDAPPPGLLARILRLPVPVLGRLDADLQPLRGQLAHALRIRRVVRPKLRPGDALHVYSQNAGLLLTKEIGRRPSVVSTDASGIQGAFLMPYRDPGHFTMARAKLSRRFEQRVFRAATLVVAQSQWAAASLRSDYGIEDDRLRVIPFGVVVPDVAAAHDEATPEITWVGTTLRRKGGERLIRIFREHLRGRCTLNLVTKDRVDDEPGIRVFRDIEPGDGLLTEILRRTAVFAFPSEMDTFGYAPLEAMALGVPVVGFRLHALPELVDDGVTGLLVEPDDEQLLDALVRLVDDHGLRVRMGAAARARVVEHFEAGVTTSALLSVIDEARARHA
jgi:glycosyltransferase involved in cell wall biosynthesis